MAKIAAYLQFVNHYLAPLALPAVSEEALAVAFAAYDAGQDTGAAAPALGVGETFRLGTAGEITVREVQAKLTDRGHRPEMVGDFVSDMAALPGAIVVPQSTAVQPPQSTEE